ncbi:hypothetical protein EV424DRAFT_1546760 [Suillus variegatus]|nr:hypothetical protein EV424DRAFT_1546760 [Suillus variegatus]
MRRVLAFLTWQVKWWSGLSSARHFKRLANIEGSAAYAKHQSALQQAAEVDDDIADINSVPTIKGPLPLDMND